MRQGACVRRSGVRQVAGRLAARTVLNALRWLLVPRKRVLSGGLVVQKNGSVAVF
jgi:hypothetical protein